MRTFAFRRTCTTAIAASLALTGLAACGSDSGSDNAGGGKTKITVNCMPPKSAKIDRKSFEDDVAAFEKANPTIDIVGRDANPCQDPKTFDAKFAGGQMEDVFYTYFTDRATRHRLKPGRRHHVLRRRTSTTTATIQPSLLDVYRQGGKVYGAVRARNYSMGLLYNRALFTQAGLDPTSRRPPGTRSRGRQEDRRPGQRLRRLRRLQREQHRRLALHRRDVLARRRRGRPRTATPGRPTSTTPRARRSCRTSRTCAGPTTHGQQQLLEWVDLLQHDGLRQARHVRRRPDNIPILVKNYKAQVRGLGLGPIPGGKGTLAGGDGYMFNGRPRPEKIQAGLKWLDLRVRTHPAPAIND